jgi:RNA recognition motif-containing protein
VALRGNGGKALSFAGDFCLYWVALEFGGARDTDPLGLCSRLPLSRSHRLGRPRRPLLNQTREASDGSSISSWSITVGKKLYVGNLTFQIGDADLEQLFSEFGTVQSA